MTLCPSQAWDLLVILSPLAKLNLSRRFSKWRLHYVSVYWRIYTMVLVMMEQEYPIIIDVYTLVLKGVFLASEWLIYFKSVFFLLLSVLFRYQSVYSYAEKKEGLNVRSLKSEKLSRLEYSNLLERSSTIRIM